MISVRDVTKIYETRHGDKLVLENINFDLAMGERLGVLGRNGAGKSTMIRLISGAEQPTAGAVERHMSVSWPLAFGGAFQPMLTGIDNIRFISRIYDQDFDSNLAFVEDFAELGVYLKEPVRTYSSGMRARLAFAISMIIEFDCFLIDEIGAVGDARFHDRCNHELFEKRGDRAMIIISHDASYVRNHCNRWGVLHDAHLALYDDFDEAYARYSEQMGLATQSVNPVVTFKNRAALLQSLSGIALADDRFRIHAQQGDWARDKGDWSGAEQEYAAALLLHPYERTYWIQQGHVMREQGKMAGAEICYRTACALGQPLQDIRVFLEAAMEGCDGASEAQFPARGLTGDATFRQPPARPDIAVLSRLFWPNDDVPQEEEVLALMRGHPSLDELASAMVADTRFSPHGRPWFGAGSGLADSSDKGEDAVADRWLANLCFLATPDFDYADASLRRALLTEGGSVLEALMSQGGFSDWPKTQAALQGASLARVVH
ncbi:hypothetical protein B2G71_05710 [Novosphingobium sp. PC22D]|uniref:ABC transporter ATP-binding protein n=1 Tax=Novosphingobium sp. PC22D TaxID=1962403 RepID=UPI000BF10422|nr:hypothetical protein B2G71_05710 [Novosphingobium sp. PC22D]